jgi:hypothetical protein
LMSLGSSPNAPRTDLIAALSTPVINGVAAAVVVFQIHKSLGPAHPLARAESTSCWASIQPIGSVERAAKAAG